MTECVADNHEPFVHDSGTPNEGFVSFVDCQGKSYLVCEHCAALWDGERWI